MDRSKFWFLISVLLSILSSIIVIRLDKYIQILKNEISYSDTYIWKHCRYNFVSKEDFEDFKSNRQEVVETWK
jgi:hypothetical protein